MLGWAYYKTITISDANVDADLADFPLLVAFDADPDIGRHARSDGFDLRFTTGDGQTELDFERESFSVSSGLACGRFWVRVPQLLADGPGGAAAQRPDRHLGQQRIPAGLAHAGRLDQRRSGFGPRPDRHENSRW